MSALQITCRGFQLSPANESLLRRQVRRLEKLSNRILRCELTIDQALETAGLVYHVHILLHLPYADVAVTHRPHGWRGAETFDAVVRAAFETARRTLLEETRMLRSFSRPHPVAVPPLGEAS